MKSFDTDKTPWLFNLHDEGELDEYFNSDHTKAIVETSRNIIESLSESRDRLSGKLCYEFHYNQDLERVYTLRDMGYDPYIMVYDKAHTTGRDNVRRLQRWVNNRIIFRTVNTFDEYIG